MKKWFLVIMVLFVAIFIPIKNKQEVSRSNFSVYLKSGDDYVESDTNRFPKNGYMLNTTESSCESGGIITQDPTTKEISVEVSGPDKCNFYFDKVSSNIMDVYNDETINKNSTDVIELNSDSSTCTNTLAYDGTVDNNLRYVGANPCNYVSFNGEIPAPKTQWAIVQQANGIIIETHETQAACQARLDGAGNPSGYVCQSVEVIVGGWRIIGIMNNVDDGTGKKETRIKLIRNESLGSYSWDTSSSSVNSGVGINNWSQSDLKNELNGDYLNTNLNANTMWYNGYQNQKTEEFDYTKSLSLAAQGMIGDAKWYLGGMEYVDSDLIPSTMYTLERGNKVWGSTSGQTCDDTACPRSLDWTGKVALPYPSDYGYATSGGTGASRSACINTLTTFYRTGGQSWANNSYMACDDNNWFPYQWAITPISNYSYRTVRIDSIGMGAYDTGSSNPVYPTVYLKSNVVISEGLGTEADPFILG